MFSEKVTVVDPEGFHMRPVSRMVAEAGKYDATVTIVHNGTEIPGNSLMAIMAADIKCGEEIEVRAEGAQEAEAGRDIVDFIASGMGE